VHDKRIELEALPSLIPPGATVAIGGAWFSNHPMAAVRELLRAGMRDLHAITILGSIDADMLIAGGALRHLTYAMVTFEALGLSLSLRQAVEEGSLPTTEISSVSLQVAFEAGARNIPFIPMPGPHGSDLVARFPDVYGTARSSFDEREVMAIRAVNPDVAILHASRCDVRGNAQFDGTYAHDPEIAQASRTVIVTCEEIVERDVIAASPHATKIPGFLVDAVIEVPFGAHPCSHVPAYAADMWELAAYQEAIAAGPEARDEYLQRLRAETEAEYRARVLPGDAGGVLAELARADVGKPDLDA
jgi:acyl CoA:acetate/3-ketoacid CoA transferase alpha subunit